MTENDPRPEEGEEAQGFLAVRGVRQEISQQSSTAIVLVVLVIAVALMGGVTILMRGTGPKPAAGQAGVEPFGPADFEDEIDWEAALNGEIPASVDEDAVFQVPPPPFSEDVFPCSECHDGEFLVTDPTPRRLTEMHEDIVIEHGTEDRWCFDCHNADNRDRLRLANGRLVRFEESYELCGQCHGTIYRDWRFGIHGRRTGSWSGTKAYLLCAHCHNPHAPEFRHLEPLPPPVRPAFLTR